jgi:hypothetical protein
MVSILHLSRTLVVEDSIALKLRIEEEELVTRDRHLYLASHDP